MGSRIVSIQSSNQVMVNKACGMNDPYNRNTNSIRGLHWFPRQHGINAYNTYCTDTNGKDSHTTHNLHSSCFVHPSTVEHATTVTHTCILVFPPRRGPIRRTRGRLAIFGSSKLTMFSIIIIIIVELSVGPPTPSSPDTRRLRPSSCGWR